MASWNPLRNRPPPPVLAALFALALALAAALAAAPSAQAQPAALERQVKAAYLLKFAAFVEWPDGCFIRHDSPLVIGVLGADELAGQLEALVAAHPAAGRPIAIKRMKHGDAPLHVHMLFLGALDKAVLGDVLGAVRGLPLLTVSDTREAYALGSMINFVVAGERLRFEVALKPAASARLRISARMLSAAYRVQPGDA